MKILLSKLQYSAHTWKVGVDFKVQNMLLAQQSGFTNTLVLCADETTGTEAIIGLNVTGR